MRREARNRGNAMTTMKRPVLAALLLSAAGAAWVRPAPPDAKPDAAAAAKGKIIYQRYCGSCHGAEARGDGPLASELRTAPSNLRWLAAKNNGQFPFAVWGEVFPKTAGTDSPSVESAVGRLTHYLWSIQEPAK
jgi:mono/diheme cytochrome c family protein